MPDLPVYSFGANFTYSAGASVPDDFAACANEYTTQFKDDSIKKAIEDNLNSYCGGTIQQDGAVVDYDIKISVVEWFPDQANSRVS